VNGQEVSAVFFMPGRPADGLPRVPPPGASVPYTGAVLATADNMTRYLEDAGPVLDPILPPESAGGRRRDVPVPGEHLDLVREPNVAEVARVLDSVLIADPS
jgi:thioesterase domain-containing protein